MTRVHLANTERDGLTYYLRPYMVAMHFIQVVVECLLHCGEFDKEMRLECVLEVVYISIFYSLDHYTSEAAQ